MFLCSLSIFCNTLFYKIKQERKATTKDGSFVSEVGLDGEKGLLFQPYLQSGASFEV